LRTEVKNLMSLTGFVLRLAPQLEQTRARNESAFTRGGTPGHEEDRATRLTFEGDETTYLCDHGEKYWR